MKIYDSHVHFWDLALNKHAWLIDKIEDSFLGNYSKICKNYLPTDLKTAAKEFDLIGATHVQAGWDSSDALNETKWLNNLYDTNKLPNAIIGYANLTLKNLSSVLEDHAAQTRFRGIRQILNWHENSYFSGCSQNIILNSNFIKGFKFLKRFKLIFELQAYSTQLLSLIPLFQQEDETQVIIEHCGLPLFLKQEDIDVWKMSLKRAAQLPHIAIKISGLEMFFQYFNKYISKKEIVAFCLNTFGIDRCLFGSNFPVYQLRQNYAETIKPILAQNLTETELQKILCKNAEKLYRT